MASVLALISKAVYEQLQRDRRAGHGGYGLGDVVALDRYTSKHAAFAQLAQEDSIVLVTVRPKGLLLVAILDRVKRTGEALVGATNRTPLVFINEQLRQLRLADGKGITAPLEKLGMSLQTPRLLAVEDIALLRGLTPTSAAAATSEVVKMKAPDKPRAAVSAHGKLRGGELGAKAKALVAQIYQHPDDRALRAVHADQLLEDQHVWGELISLQLADPKRNAAQIEQIFKQHARDIVGDIANVAARDSITIVDGFPHTVECAKSKTFTSADERHTAAIAPQWATVRTVRLTGMMTGTFIRELLHNPASANLTKIEDGNWNEIKPQLVRADAGAPWQVVGADCGRVLDGLPDAELARIPAPAKPALVEELVKARARRVKQLAAKPKSKPKR